MWSYTIKSQYVAENLICVFCLCPQVPAKTKLHQCSRSVHTFLLSVLVISLLYAWGIRFHPGGVAELLCRPRALT